MLIQGLLYNIGGFTIVLLLHGQLPTMALIVALALFVIALTAFRRGSLWRWPRSGPTNYTRY